MIKERIKANKVLYPIARGTKKAIVKSWAEISQLRKPKSCVEIEKYKGIHKGERCFIVCTGPSLTLEDLAKIKDAYSFSMNSIVNLYDRTDYRPTYYLLQDGRVEKRLRNKLLNMGDVTCFMGVGNIAGFKIAGVLGKSQARRYKDKYIFYNLNVAYHIYDMYYTDDCKIFTLFSTDCAREIYDGCTVTYSAIQLACYMGFNEIYLIGCDTNMSGHVDEKMRGISAGDRKPVNQTLNALLPAYKVAREFAETHGIKIYNATRGGNLEIFERVNFDNLFF